ncbi:hypothetical protein [Maritalea myrionectae]|uniref:hypothetical protein n=1 Tax=Maritalea myrionectae TaxID=454601 RepID=UPI0004034F98|nr:hypothetical protein [Maritalea myrionectae]
MAEQIVPYHWFGCSDCDTVWMGALKPVNAKQYTRMFKENKFCPQCNRRTAYHPGLPKGPIYSHHFSGSIRELTLDLQLQRNAA